MPPKKRPFVRHRREPGEIKPARESMQQTPKTTGEPRLRIIPIGGLEEVGRNMTVFEYGNDIVILDMGLQFPEEDMPGIDYVIPNISYLKGKERNVRGVILSHGHLDHIGAAPILLRDLGYPLTIGRDLTLALVKRRMFDLDKNSVHRLKTLRINSLSDKIALGKFNVEFFEIEHSIMDAVGVILKTPDGTVIHPGDWTMEKDPIGREPITYSHLASLPQPRILMLESLGATNLKTSPVTEKEMYKNLFHITDTAKGRVIIGTFSSQVSRIGKIIEHAEMIGKKVVLDGYSMKMNIGIAKDLGYIKMHKDTLVPVSEIHQYPASKIIVICTGAQGEGRAVLSRIINDEHRYIKIVPNDTVVFSSSVIPGNERTVQRLKDKLYRKCDNVIHTDILDVHISGHSGAKEIQEMVRQVRPDYFLPVYANHYFLKESAKLAMEVGMRKDRIFVLDNGSQLEFHQGKATLLHKKADTSYVIVDGFSIGEVSEAILHDRLAMAEDGVVVIFSVVNARTGKVMGDPDIISRGFVYMRDSKDLINEIRRRTVTLIEKQPSRTNTPGTHGNENGDTGLKNAIREHIGEFFLMKMQRKPMVIPVIKRI